MINNNPLVSVVIPARNRWDELQMAIDSCLKQKYQPLEILVYDDASDENIGQLVQVKYSTVKTYRSEQNVGQVILRNKGFNDAKGKYIFSLDDDSYFNDDQTVTNVVAVLDKYLNVAAVALPYVEPSLHRSYFVFEEKSKSIKSTSIYATANFTACAAAFRRQAIIELKGYCDDLFFGREEDELSLRILDKGWDIIALPITPLIHLFSDIRDWEKFYFLLPRNSILFIFYCAPTIYLIPKVIRTTLGMLWHGIVIGKPFVKLQGLIEGYRLSLKSWERRNPVSRNTWRKFRRLLKKAELYEPA